MLFMFFNATIVFGGGLIRWAAAAMLTVLAALWLKRVAVRQQ
jgi:hypothetical protein